MIQANVNDIIDFLIDHNKDQTTVNGEPVSYELNQIDQYSYHIIYKHKNYVVTIHSSDHENKVMEIDVNGRMYTVKTKNERDLLISKMGMNNRAAKKVSVLKAPMPGLITDIKVEEGEQVKADQPLVILKAMKMENVLRSPGDLTISKVYVEVDQKVEKDTAILQF